MNKVIPGIFVFLFCARSFSQQNVNYNKGGLNTITTAVPFLLITPESRGGGMGETGAASSPDASSMYWNPAKYAFAQKDFGITMAYTPWLRQLVPDMSLSYLAGYKKINKNAAIASSLRYFTLGSVQFTDNSGNSIGTYKPSELAFDAGYSQKLGQTFSVGMAARYIYSNLTNGIPIPGSSTTTRAGQSLAVDIAAYYRSKKVDLGEKKGEFGAGLNISNIGQKISYTDNAEASAKSFIPTQMRLGGSMKLYLDEYNTITFLTDITKLLVPTPPIWQLDASGNRIPDGNGSYLIAAGKDPYRSVTSGIVGSFSDAPGGAKEELREFVESVGMEYWYDNLLAFRMGYYHEDKTKGGRQYLTFGLGLKYSVFGIDLSYLAPLTQRNPLQNTLRFTLTFDFDAYKKDAAQPPAAQ